MGERNSFDEIEVEINDLGGVAAQSTGRKSVATNRVSLPNGPTTGQRNVSKRKRLRKLDKNRRSLMRLTEFQLTEEEQETELPPVAYNKRKMTDFMFLFLFFSFWIGLWAIAGIGYKFGNPASLIYGRDSEGRICGDVNDGFSIENRFSDFNVDHNMENKPLIVFPRVEQDQQLRVAGLDIEFDLLDFDFFKVCTDSCPQEGDLVCTAEAEAIISDYRTTDIGQTDTRTRDEIIGGCLFDDDVRLDNVASVDCINNALAQQCFETFFNTTNFLFRCFPEYIYEVELIGNETGCLEERTTSTIFGQRVEDCFKFKQVSKVTRVEPPDSNFVFDTFNTFSRKFDQLLGDVINARDVIIGCGVGVAFATSFLYIMALKVFVGCVIWTTIIAGLLMSTAVTMFLYLKAGLITESGVNEFTTDVSDFASGAQSFVPFGEDGEDNLDNFTAGDIEIESTIELPDFVTASRDFAFEFEVVAYIMTVVTGILLLVILFSASRVNRAIEFFKEASRCIRSKPQLLITPFVSSFAGALVIAFYVSSALYVTSAGTLENSTAVNTLLATLNTTNEEEFLDTKVFGPLDTQTLMNLYLFFGFLWSLNFVSAVNLMTISGVVSKWYWAGSPSNRKSNILEGEIKISLCASFCTVIRYHLGTAAFGSLLIAMIQFVRYMAAFIQARMNKISAQSRCIKILWIALNCCLKCAENCVKFISANAYIMTMLYGTSFCTSTKMAFTAFAQNLIQVATVTFLGDIILRFGQMFIVATSVFISFVVLDGSSDYQLGGEKELSSIVFPVFITAFLSFFMAKQVLSVYNVAIDTILLSYCQDKKLIGVRNKRRRMKAHKDMQLFVENNKPEEDEFMRQPSLAVYV